MIKILVIDDDPFVKTMLDALKPVGTRNRLIIHHFYDGENIEPPVIEENGFTAVFVDWSQPVGKSSGESLIKNLLKMGVHEDKIWILTCRARESLLNRVCKRIPLLEKGGENFMALYTAICENSPGMSVTIKKVKEKVLSLDKKILSGLSDLPKNANLEPTC